MITETFKDIIKNLPEEPGIYKYLNKENIIIYIGKAKNLKKRVSSYFNKDLISYKTEVLVKSIEFIEYIVVNNEHEALLLENNLIKEHKPKYNINLKDDKTFPYIVIKNENFPRVIFSRQKNNDKSEYLGPFTNVFATKFVFDFIKEYYPLRNCNLNLSPKKILENKYKVCLQYHIKKCKAPCINLQTEEDYNNNISEIRGLMKTNFKSLIVDLRQKMIKESNELNFELAQVYKDKIEILENFNSSSIIESSNDLNIDVFAIDFLDKIGILNYIKVRNGKFSFSKNLNLDTKLDETKEEILQFAIMQIYLENECEVDEIIVPFEINEWNDRLKINVPKQGDKKKYLDLALKNVEYLKLEKRRQKLNLTNIIEKDKQEILEKIKTDLHLKELPTYIECFDNSNFQGSYPISAMVCFKNGIPSKNDYRVFKVKTVKGIDDFATMKEVVFRRYKRLLENELPLPNLIIIDGGKGQLNAAIESLNQLNLFSKIAIVGLAKNQEEIFFYDDKDSIKLNYNSESLKLIIQIRDEVHRFGINFHRKLRSKGTIKTELSNIDGIGDILGQKLLKYFGSVKNIKQQSEAEIAEVIGNAKAKLIIQYFDKNI